MGYETFFGTVDVVATMNWLKKVFDTLTDMDLENDLKLRVAFRLIDNSVTTWWDNVKLRSAALAT